MPGPPLVLASPPPPLVLASPPPSLPTPRPPRRSSSGAAASVAAIRCRSLASCACVQRAGLNTPVTKHTRHKTLNP
eukprot:353916-Chlamydomonas_euryale.AAC.7